MTIFFSNLTPTRTTSRWSSSTRCFPYIQNITVVIIVIPHRRCERSPWRHQLSLNNNWSTECSKTHSSMFSFLSSNYLILIEWSEMMFWEDNILSQVSLPDDDQKSVIIVPLFEWLDPSTEFDKDNIDPTFFSDDVYKTGVVFGFCFSLFAC